jgi:hypothetical protein
MTRSRSTLPLALALVLLSVPTGATAQIPWQPQLRLGLTAGPDLVPAAMRKYHVDPHESALGFGLAARAAIAVAGPAGVEGRVGISSGPALPVVNPNEPGLSGTLELERSAVTPSLQAFWDLRLRLVAPSGSTVGTLGGGLMTENIRFIVGSVGHRWGPKRAFGVDLEVAAYDLPWQRIVYDVHADGSTSSSDPVYTLGDVHASHIRRWDLGVGLRFVYERAIF